MKIYIRSNDRGSVLMAVIWMLAMLAVFTVAVNRQASQQLMFGPWIHDRVQARALANAGIARAMLELRVDKFKTFDALNEDWASNENAFRDIPLGEGTFSVECSEGDAANGKDEPRYGFCDESGRINVNLASREVLTRLVSAVSGSSDEEKARETAESIIDWRDADDSQLQSGAESSYYRGLPAPYVARNEKMQSVDELRMIKGIDQKLFMAIKPFVTIFGKNTININTASAISLQAIGFSPNLAQATIESRRGADGIIGTKDDEVFQDISGIAQAIGSAVPLSADDHAAISEAASLGLITVQSNTFRIRSIGRLKKDGSAYEHWITCVVTRNGSILYWREGEEG